MKKKYIISLIVSVLIFLPPIIIHQSLSQDEKWSALEWLNLFYLIAFVESGIMFFIFSQYLHDRQEDRKKEASHSQDIENALAIMKDGEFAEYSNEIQFLVAYPYLEYIEDRRKTLHPTKREIHKFADDFFNRKNPPDERTLFEFVPLKLSPEAKFEWAIEHLEAYKDIKQKFDKAKTTQTEYVNFVKENNSELVKYSNGYEPSNTSAKELFDNLNIHIDNSNIAIHELRQSVEKLYYELKNGGIVKGKCHICEKSFS